MVCYQTMNTDESNAPITTSQICLRVVASFSCTINQYKNINSLLRWPGMVEDDPDYNCCYETDESNVNPVCMGRLSPEVYRTVLRACVVQPF